MELQCNMSTFIYDIMFNITSKAKFLTSWCMTHTMQVLE